jgi:hypothetical protein
MSKNFDEERRTKIDALGDRTFEVGGEKFTRRATLRPDSVLKYAALLAGELSPEESLKRSDEGNLTLIEAEGHERWRAIREREEDAIDNETINGVLNWLIAEAVGRPTEAPVSSGNGRDKSGTPSKGKSSSAVAAG